MTPRLWAVVVLVALVLVAGAVAALTMPWHRPPAPRPDQLAALRELPADQVARARAFRAELRVPMYLGLGVALIVAFGLGFSPLGPRLVDLVSRPFGNHWAAQAVIGGFAVVLMGEIAGLPFAAWRNSVVVTYGLSTQGWGGWAVDLLKSYAVGAVIGGIALLGFYGVTRLASRWWWAFGAAGAAVLVALLSFVLPVVVEPIFNRFTPMAEGPLRTELLDLARRDGVPVKDVLVADASRRTRAVNAYVSGYGPTRRIVVYDTLLTEATPDEVAGVVAHELGHAARNDVLAGTILGAAGAAAAVILLYVVGGFTPLLRLVGVTDIGQPRAVALLVALATIGGLAAGPAQAFVSRRIEARADHHALELTGDPVTFEAMQRRLALVNLADPDPPTVEYLLYASHPSTVERVAAARAYARGER